MKGGKKADYSATDNCETALEIAYAVGDNPESSVYNWNEVLKSERCYSNPDGDTFTEF